MKDLVDGLVVVLVVTAFITVVLDDWTVTVKDFFNGYSTLMAAGNVYIYGTAVVPPFPATVTVANNLEVEPVYPPQHETIDTV